jgi:putative DNA primase/helicase
MSRQTAAEILAKHGIVAPTAPGQHSATCPQCSAGRKPEHQKTKCLGVKVDNVGVQWRCCHCDWNGGEFFERRSSASPFIAEYIYKQVDGSPYLKVCKTKPAPGRRSQFPQFHRDGDAWVKGKPRGSKIPYRLPQLAAAAADVTVYVCEGEKDADSVAKIGLVATTASEGAAAKWKPELNCWFKDRRVVILVDADAPGRTHGQKVARALHRVAASVKVVDLYPERTDGSDVSDWLVKDSVGVKLLAAVKDAPEWDPESAKDSSSSSADDAALIAELAALPPLDYAKRRKAAAEKLGIRVTELDEAVKAARDSSPAESLYPHWDVEPVDEPVDPERLITDLTTRICSHIAMAPEAALVTVLWVILTWVHKQAVIHSPILLVTSPEPNSGKSTLMGVLDYLAYRALSTVGVTAAALYRSIEKWEPTVIVDEADKLFINNDDLRQVVNSGWTRGQGVLRCDGENNEPHLFPTFCPKAIAMKGMKLPDTTLSRAVVIGMERKAPGEQTASFRCQDDADFAALRRRLARYAIDNADALAKADPTLPPGFENRKAANWRLLLAIGDTAGKAFGRKARAAAEKISGAVVVSSTGIDLLADIRKILEPLEPKGTEPKEAISSAGLAVDLGSDPESQWSEFGKARKPITQKQIAALLKSFGIFPRAVHPPKLAADAKGYERIWFKDAWRRYLDPETPPPSSDPEPAAEAKSASDTYTPDVSAHSDPSTRPSADDSTSYTHFSSVREPPSGRMEKGLKPLKEQEMDGWTDREAQDEGGAYETTPESPPWEEPQVRVSPEDRHPSGERACQQCGDKEHGTERQFVVEGRSVWLHPECRRFYPGGAAAAVETVDLAPQDTPPPPPPDPWVDLGIPAFLDRTNGDRAPALGPPGDSLDDFQ